MRVQLNDGRAPTFQMSKSVSGSEPTFTRGLGAVDTPARLAQLRKCFPADCTVAGFQSAECALAKISPTSAGVAAGSLISKSNASLPPGTVLNNAIRTVGDTSPSTTKSDRIRQNTSPVSAPTTPRAIS